MTWSPSMTAEPFAGSLTSMSVRTPASGSRSFARTGMTTGTPVVVAAESGAAMASAALVGAACRAMTEMAKTRAVANHGNVSREGA
ncbi:MAG: hypothetical protein AMXMBFR23_25730 [Chloroflexota bacterium]